MAEIVDLQAERGAREMAQLDSQELCIVRCYASGRVRVWLSDGIETDAQHDWVQRRLVDAAVVVTEIHLER